MGSSIKLLPESRFLSEHLAPLHPLPMASSFTVPPTSTPFSPIFSSSKLNLLIFSVLQYFMILLVGAQGTLAYFGNDSLLFGDYAGEF